MFNAEFDTVVFDVDGTLLNSDHQLLPATIRVVRQLIADGVFVMLATGKTYYSTRELRQTLGLTTYGVYVQGLVVCDGVGTVLEQRLLDATLVADAMTLADAHGFELVAYSGSRLLTPRATETTALMQTYHEPLPQAVTNLHGEPVNKLLLLGTQGKLAEVRPKIATLLADDARLVQAVPGMLEIVPYGTSKGATVARILRRLGRSAEQTLAFGDGENDIELLQWARIGVAMGNASEAVKNSANFIITDNDHEGIATLLQEISFVGS